MRYSVTNGALVGGIVTLMRCYGLECVPVRVGVAYEFKELDNVMDGCIVLVGHNGYLAACDILSG